MNGIINTLHGKPDSEPPMWLMRQAGRILPEYRATRERAKNFIGLVTNPELARRCYARKLHSVLRSVVDNHAQTLVEIVLHVSTSAKVCLRAGPNK